MSREFNNAKKNKSNEEFVNKKNIQLTKEGKNRALEDSKQARKSIKKNLLKRRVSNIAHTGHSAGLDAAQNTAQFTGILNSANNIVAVINNEKDVEEAIYDAIENTGKSTLQSYVIGGSSTIFRQTFSNSKSKIMQLLNNSKVQNNIITAIMVTGDSLSRWANNEISEQELILELGEKGVSTVATGQAILIGQVLIPIPVLGGVIGAMIGSTLASQYCQSIIQTLQQHQIEEEERRQLIECHKQATQELRRYQAELEEYLQDYFSEYRYCFEDAIGEIQQGLASGDSLSMISGANRITQKLGGKVNYNTLDEFDTYFDSDEVDVF